MNILIDTHIFMWAYGKTTKRLAPRLEEIVFDRSNRLYFSMAGIWEMQIKEQSSKLPLTVSVKQLVEFQTTANAITILPVEERHIWGLRELTFYHRDPFDRIMIAQANVENLHLMSVDKIFKYYPVQLIS